MDFKRLRLANQECQKISTATKTHETINSKRDVRGLVSISWSIAFGPAGRQRNMVGVHDR